MSVSTQSQKLPSKEASIFKKIVRCYELKQYKNGLKFARQILSNPKYSEHGETLAMKGLIMNCQGRKEEANDLVKKGLKNDLRSHVCWHVFGLLQRSDKKYDEAIKAYRNALKWDKDNVQILKDLSLLQIQMRDLEGFRDTRYQLLRVRPAQRSSWVGYSLAYLLLKDYAMAAKIISEYRKTTTPQAKPDTEFSELVLYEVQVMMEGDMHEAALKHMNSFESNICDTGCVFENKATIHLALGQHKKAELLYRDLISRNTENYGYLEGLEKSLNLKTPEERLALYAELIIEYPRSHCIKRMPLLIATGRMFQDLLDPFLRVSLHKGIPSLFIGLRPFYKDPEKVKIISELLDGYVESLKTCGRFHPDDSGREEPPSSLLWSVSLLAQHKDAVGQSLKSLKLINEAIDHTPTDVQLYMIKARIFKHAGDLKEAAKWMEEARTLDTADRYVNCKCVKYLFRVDQIDKAVETAGLFTREGLHPLQTMDEMQCMWFQTEMAMAHWRLGQLGEALVKLHEIDKHFTDIIDDQFDFHTYCIRRTTLRAYVDVLRLEDHLRQHPSYSKAAKAAIELYVYLHDNPDAKKGKPNGSLPNASELSASELKKLQRKQKKAQLKAKAKAQEEKENKPQKQQQQSQQQQQQNEEEKKQEEKEKFNPKELLEVENPLEVALKFLVPLQMFSRGRIASHLLAYSIHSRRRKFLLMLQSLKRSQQIDPENGELHTNVVDFILASEASKSELSIPVKTVIEESLASLTGGLNPKELNQQFLQKHPDSLDHLIHGAQVLYRLQPELRDKAVGYVTDLSDQLKGRTLENCLRVRDLLRNGSFGNCPEEALQDYEQRCRQLFPLATALKPPAPPTAAEDSSADSGSAPDKPLPSQQQS